MLSPITHKKKKTAQNNSRVAKSAEKDRTYIEKKRIAIIKQPKL